MTVSLLLFLLSGVMSFGGRMLIYCTVYEDWLKYWAYGAYGFAVLLAIAGIVEFFKSIARACRRNRARRGAMPPKRRRRRPR